MRTISSDSDHLRNRRLVFYRDSIPKINAILDEYLRLAEARCNLLIDKAGHMVAQVGSDSSVNLETISALVAGSFAATSELARNLGEEEFPILFLEGKDVNIQLLLVDPSILVTIFDDKTTRGMVQFYSKPATQKLSEILKKIASKPKTLRRQKAKRSGAGDGFEAAEEVIPTTMEGPPPDDTGFEDGSLDDLFG